MFLSSSFQSCELTYAHFVKFPSWNWWRPGLSPGYPFSLPSTCLLPTYFLSTFCLFWCPGNSNLCNTLCTALSCFSFLTFPLHHFSLKLSTLHLSFCNALDLSLPFSSTFFPFFLPLYLISLSFISFSTFLISFGPVPFQIFLFPSNYFCTFHAHLIFFFLFNYFCTLALSILFLVNV